MTTLRVLLVDMRSQCSCRLAQALEAADFDVVGVVDRANELRDRVGVSVPDAVIVDTEMLGRDTFELLVRLGKPYATPVIVFTDTMEADVPLDAARMGITAYAVETLASTALRSLVEVAIAHFRSNTLLRNELIKARRSLESRRRIDRAKCRLMERYGIGEKPAYQRLRKLAMDRRMNLDELAREILSTGSND